MKNALSKAEELFKLRDKAEKNFNNYIKLQNGIQPQKESMKISGIYGIFGALWILFSGKVIHFIAKDMDAFERIEVYKGWIFIVVTVIMLYSLIVKELMMFKLAVQKIFEAYKDLQASFTKLTEAEEKLILINEKLEKQRNALAISEQRYNLAVVGSKDGIWDWDIEKNIFFISTMDKKLNFNGNEKIEMTFEIWKQNLHPEEREAVVARLNNYLESGEGVYKDTYRVWQEGEGYNWILSRGQAIWNKNGRPLRIAGSNTDITDQIKLQEVFREIKSLSDNIFDNAPMIIAISNTEGKLLKFNKYTEKILGYSSEELFETHWMNKFIRLEEKEVTDHNTHCNLEGNFENIIVSKDGRQFNFLWTNTLLYNGIDAIIGIVSMGMDITELKSIEKRLHHMAYYNVFLNIHNRAWFEEEASKILDGDKLSSKKIALLYMDMDNFKYINDTMGHYVGDKVLKHISHTINNYIGETDIAAHMSGDEFVVLFTALSDVNEMIKKIKELKNLLEVPWEYNQQKFFITISIGAALYPEHGTDLVTLLKNADTSMYYTKELGKHGYSIYSEFLGSKALHYSYFVNELKKAIKNDEFTLFYQPLININTGKVKGMETLIRWKHPSKGWIPPSEFIPIAERCGLILDIGRWIFEKACQQKRDWDLKGFDKMTLSINLSSKELMQKSLLTFISHIIDKYSLDYKFIQVEITETTAMMNMDTSIKVLGQLKSLGVKVALDDFGTGYSSLNYLKSLPIDVIKLDGSFIKSVVNENQEEEIINAVIQLGHILNLEVLAEGIETREQLLFLKKHNCDTGQGFLFSRPLPSGEIEQLISRDVIL